MLCGERAVEAHHEHPDLLALPIEVIYHLAGGVGHATHADDSLGSLRIAVVVEEMVMASGNLSHLIHVVLHYAWDGHVVGIAGLAVLEVDIGVLGSTTGYGVLIAKRTVTERLHRIPIHQMPHILSG